MNEARRAWPRERAPELSLTEDGPAIDQAIALCKPRAAVITIIVSELRDRPGCFEARVDGKVLCTSRQPLLDGARELLARGHDPTARAVMRHAGSAIDAIGGVIGRLAKLTTEESSQTPLRVRRWKAPPLWEGSPRIARPDLAA